MPTTPEGTEGDGRKRDQGICCVREEACRADTMRGLHASPPPASRHLQVWRLGETRAPLCPDEAEGWGPRFCCFHAEMVKIRQALIEQACKGLQCSFSVFGKPNLVHSV